MQYDAFISYSHSADSGLAPSLEQGLEQFAKPIFKRSALRIFRDANDLSASPNLWGKIEEGLSRSDYFIFMASPRAARSKWCRKEVEYWKNHKPADHFLVVLTEGELVWDDSKRDFDWDKTTAIPPNLSGVFENEPLFVDFRKRPAALSLDDPVFHQKIVLLAATIHGRTIEDMIGEGVRQHRRTIRIRNTAIVLLSLLLVASLSLGLYALQQQSIAEANAQRANEEAENALQQQSIAEANAQRANKEAENARMQTDTALAAQQRAEVSESTARRERDNAQRQAIIAENMRATAANEALRAKIAQLAAEARLYQDIDPLRGFRLAELGYQAAKKYGLPTEDFEKVLTVTAYGRKLYLDERETFSIERNEQRWSEPNAILGLELVNVEKAQAKIIEKDEKGELIREYPFQVHSASWTTEMAFGQIETGFITEDFIYSKQRLSGDGGPFHFYLWDRRDGQLVYHSEISYFNAWRYLFDKKRGNIIMADDQNGYKRVHLQKGYDGDWTKMQEYDDFGHLTTALELSTSGRYLVAGSERGEVKVFDLGHSYWSSAPVVEFIAHPNQPILEVAFCNNEAVIRTATNKERKYWPLKEGGLFFQAEEAFRYRRDDPITLSGIDFDRDSIQLVSRYGKLVLTNKGLYAANGEQLIPMNYSNGASEGYCGFAGGFSKSGRYIVVDVDCGGDALIYPIHPELIIEAVNDQKALGTLGVVDVQEWEDLLDNQSRSGLYPD